MRDWPILKSTGREMKRANRKTDEEHQSMGRYEPGTVMWEMAGRGVAALRKLPASDRR
jgi:hypothetical protein